MDDKWIAWSFRIVIVTVQIRCTPIPVTAQRIDAAELVRRHVASIGSLKAREFSRVSLNSHTSAAVAITAEPASLIGRATSDKAAKRIHDWLCRLHVTENPTYGCGW